MREQQRLEREYHDHRIISIQNMEPHQPGDGWIHSVYDADKALVATSNTLAAAIQCAKQGKYPGKYTEQDNIEAVAKDIDGTFRPLDELEDIPEIEENE